MKIDTAAVRQCLKSFDFTTLFREHLGWDNLHTSLNVAIDGHTFSLTAAAHKRNFVAYVCQSIPDRQVRVKIDHQVTKSTKEHFVVYCDQVAGQQVWNWVRREPGRPLASRDHRFDICAQSAQASTICDRDFAPIQERSGLLSSQRSRYKAETRH